MHTFVIPARDEAASLSAVLRDINVQATRLQLAHNVIVVDDHSMDATAAVAQSHGATVVPCEDSGLAAAFRTGVAHAVRQGAEYIIHLDADGQYNTDDLPRLLDAAGPRRLVIGNRLASRPDGMSDIRFEGNKDLTRIVSALAGTDLSDTQSGFRVFDRTLATSIAIRSQFTYTQEQAVRAARAGIRIVQPPITFRRRQHGRSRLVRSPFYYLSRVMEDLDRLAAELDVDAESLTMPPA